MIIFLGLMYSNKSITYCNKYAKNGIQYAPHLFQSNLIQGLVSNEQNVAVLNIPPMGSFPINSKKLFLTKESWGNNNVQIPYINLPIIKKLMQKTALKTEIKKIIHSCQNEEISIIAYSPYIPFLEVLRWVKIKYPRIKTNLIVTDCIPGREDMDKYMTPKAKKDGDRIVKLAKCVDTFTFLSKHLATALEIGEKPYVLTECICNENQELSTVNEKSNNVCLYAGGVNEEYGIVMLAEAFVEMTNAELWICGNGNAVEKIKSIAVQKTNIKYFGFLSQCELQDLRNKCDFLINPRMPTGTYTKYSFPSKTAEYMVSGKPVIMYKLEGIPNDYDEFLNYITAKNSLELKCELEKIFSSNYLELTKKSLKAREFMLNNKTSIIQAKNILNLIWSNSGK